VNPKRRLLPAVVAALALPAAMAPGRCGFIVDFTESLLFPETIDRVVLDADDGSMIAVAYTRTSTMLKRHTYGFEPSLGQVSNTVTDGTLELDAHCKYEGNCTFDHMFELPLGVSFEISMLHAEMALGYISGDIEAAFESGWFKGVRLESQNLHIALDDGDITSDHAVAPASVTIELGTGTVDLTVPPGSYVCRLDSGKGDVKTDGITCDDAADAILDVQVGTGDITITGSK